MSQSTQCLGSVVPFAMFFLVAMDTIVFTFFSGSPKNEGRGQKSFGIFLKFSSKMPKSAQSAQSAQSAEKCPTVSKSAQSAQIAQKCSEGP